MTAADVALLPTKTGVCGIRRRRVRYKRIAGAVPLVGILGILSPGFSGSYGWRLPRGLDSMLLGCGGRQSLRLPLPQASWCLEGAVCVILVGISRIVDGDALGLLLILPEHECS